jgi:hypothetical protein
MNARSSFAPVPNSNEVEGFIAIIKLMGLHPSGHKRYRYCQQFMEEMAADAESKAELNEAGRLMRLADNGDEASRALVDSIAPEWEFGQDLDTEDADGRCQTCGRGGPTKASKGRGRQEDAQGAAESADAPYAPSTEPGSAPDVLWQALVALSTDGKPVEADAWRDAALIALARSGRIANPVEAFRDAKRRLKGQRAYEETKNGAILRKI